MEPDQRVLVPPAGGGRDAGAGDRVRARRPRSTCSTQCARRDGFPKPTFPKVVERISFFLNSGIRFVEEICKVRALTELWDRITLERYGITDPKARRFRYGVQVNSLGLTEAQPENNVPRIVLETLGCHAVEAGAGPGRAAPGVERGARAAAGRGTSSGRCASSRCSRSRPTCSSTTTSSTGRSSSNARPPSSSVAATDRARPHPRRRRRVRQHRAAQGRARAVARGPHAPHRVGRHLDRRCEHLRGDRAVAAPRAARGRSVVPRRRSRGRERAGVGDRQWRAARDGAAVGARGRRLARRPRRPTAPSSWLRRSRSHARVARSASGRARCARCSASTARRPGIGRVASASSSGLRRGAGTHSCRGRRRVTGRSGCSSASPGSTVTPTAPSRSRWPRATRAWRSSTRASG